MSVSDDFSDQPLSHLQVAGLAFEALTSEPRLLSLDCSTLDGRRDLAEQGLHVKLCWAGYRAGYDVRYADADVVYCDDLDNEAAAPHRPYGHVDLLLARAVALELIDPDEAALIIDTRLEYQPI